MTTRQRPAPAVFSAREVIAAGEAFRRWGREIHDPGVALDELTSLEPREPTVLRVAVGAGRPRSAPLARARPAIPHCPAPSPA